MTATSSAHGRRELWLLESANALGGVANALVMVVIPWLVLDRTGSAAMAGLAGALAGLPGIVMAPVVGVMVDRLGRRTVSVASDVLSALSVVLFPVLDAVGLLAVWVILALAVLGAAFDPAGYTARKALIPDTAKASRVARDQLNGWHEGVFAGGWIVGPMVGALGIAAVGPVTTMWFAGAGFVTAAVTVALIRVPDRAAGGLPVDTTHWQSAREGLRVLVGDRPVWMLTLVVTGVWMVYAPTESVLLPVHFEATDRPGAFGLVLSGMSAGGMLGAFGYGRLARRFSRRRITTMAMALTAVAYLPIALLPPPALMVPAAVLLGLAWGPMEPLLNSLVQDRFPAHQHGRVYGVQLGVCYAAPPLGQLVSGAAVQAYGIEPVLLAVFGGLSLAALVVAVAPSLHGLDDRQGVDPATAEP
jgi:MFS family permease